MKIGIKSIGAYLPYHYMTRSALSGAWGGRGGKGEKAIADVDEDSITMAVEAAMGCFRYVDRYNISALYFATTTAPYAEKSNSSLISVAVDLNDEEIFTTDVAASTRAGTNALIMAYNAAKADAHSNTLVTASDMRNSFPKSVQEANYGDGAAAVVVGSGDDVWATIDYISSVNEEINDYWRISGKKYTRHAEGRFCDEEGYLRELNIIMNKIKDKTGMKSADFNKVVLVGQNTKLKDKFSLKQGFVPEQMTDTLLTNVGDTGAAQGLLGLVNAMEQAQPGEKILLLDYGNGANAMILTVTEQIKNLGGRKQIEFFLNHREELNSYARFLSWRDIAPAEPGGEFKLGASTAQTWREQNINIRLHGSVCNQCSAALYPVSRVCDNCASKDDYREFRLSDHILKLYTYSIDEYAGRSDDPSIVQAVAEDISGCRVYTTMTNYDRKKLFIGMEVEFTFRKMHDLGNFPNYFWKLRPLRREMR